MGRVLALAGAAAVATTACSVDTPDSGATVRDSAGVHIVENRGAPAWTTATAWTVSDTPSVSIGGDETDSMSVLSRVQSATSFADGRIVIANYGTRQLRFHDSNGRFLKSVGRLGAGPGEFNWLGKALRTEGDSLIFWDPNNARLSVFDSAGRFVRAVPLRSGQGISFPAPIGRASDGSLIGLTGPLTMAVGAIRNPVIVVRYGPDLAPIDTIAKRPGSERFTHPCRGGMCGYDAPFARSTRAVFRHDRLYVGSADRYEIEVIDLEGRVIRSIRLARPTREVSRDEAARQRDTFLGQARNPEQRRRLEEVYALMTVPTAMPAYQDLTVDRAGNLWVEEYRVTDDEAPSWTVFDTAGRMMGTIRTPRALRIDEINDDFLLGVFRDSLDVEQVRMHRISKPSGGRRG
jgi:hypothetical protein